MVFPINQILWGIISVPNRKLDLYTLHLDKSLSGKADKTTPKVKKKKYSNCQDH